MAIERGRASAKLSVTIETRDDGGLRVYSDDVPELILSHHDAEAVLADIEPALEVILAAKLGCAVTVNPLVGLREMLQDAGVIGHDMPAHLCARSYVAHIG